MVFFSFDEWLEYQAVSRPDLSSEQEEEWSRAYHEAYQRWSESLPTDIRNFQKRSGEFLYAVAERDDKQLYLALWIRRSNKGEIFVLIPRSDRKWNPHFSYHQDGRSHHKSHNHKTAPLRRQQPGTNFHGNECLGGFATGDPKSGGVTFDPTSFTGVIEVGWNVLGTTHGSIILDVVEPGCEPIPMPFKNIVACKTFQDVVPWLVVRIAS